MTRLDQQMAIDHGIVESIAAAPAGDLTINAGWELYLNYAGREAVLGGVSAATAKRYRAVRDTHIAFCRKHGISMWNDFDRAALERYGNWRAKSKAPRTVFFELTLFKSAASWLVSEGHLPEKARLRYRLTKPVGTDTYCYQRAEVAAMIAHCEATPGMEWLRRVIIALSHTGLRIGELAQLRWRDLDLLAGTLHVADERASRKKVGLGVARRTKGKRSRIVPIHPVLMALLKSMEPAEPGVVFRASRGGVLRPRNVLEQFISQIIEPLQDRFSAAAGETGFEHGRLHSFRHYFCSQALWHGANEGEVREWLGHSDSKLVEHYRHLAQGDAKRRMAQLSFLGGDAAEKT